MVMVVLVWVVAPPLRHTARKVTSMPCTPNFHCLCRSSCPRHHCRNIPPADHSSIAKGMMTGWTWVVVMMMVMTMLAHTSAAVATAAAAAVGAATVTVPVLIVTAVVSTMLWVPGLPRMQPATWKRKRARHLEWVCMMMLGWLLPLRLPRLRRPLLKVAPGSAVRKTMVATPTTTPRRHHHVPPWPPCLPQFTLRSARCVT